MAAMARSETVPAKILAFLREWWVDHELMMDRKFADFIRSEGRL
jgi:hypothetical protein